MHPVKYVNDSSTTHFRLMVLFVAVWAGVCLTGCSRFEHDWKSAADRKAECGVCGCWTGTWLSDVNGHTGKLRCILTQKTDGNFRAQYHATYAKILRFKTDITLYPSPPEEGDAEGTVRFRGKQDIGWLAGGVYEYDGYATANEFILDYKSRLDHGTNKLSRP